MSLYIVSHLLVVVGGNNIVNAVTTVLFYPYMTLSIRDSTKESEGYTNINGSHISEDRDVFDERWFLRKLLLFQGKTLSDDHLCLFNTSYQQAWERLPNELDGCWFDHILIL